MKRQIGLVRSGDIINTTFDGVIVSTNSGEVEICSSDIRHETLRLEKEKRRRDKQPYKSSPDITWLRKFFK